MKRKTTMNSLGLLQLDLGGCTRITERTLITLSNSIGIHLQEFDLRGLKLSNRILDALYVHMKHTLKILTLIHCTGFTHDKLIEMKEKWTSCTIVT
jgi:hypothetical protein